MFGYKQVTQAQETCFGLKWMRCHVWFRGGGLELEYKRADSLFLLTSLIHVCLDLWLFNFKKSSCFFHCSSVGWNWLLRIALIYWWWKCKVTTMQNLGWRWWGTKHVLNAEPMCRAMSRTNCRQWHSTKIMRLKVGDPMIEWNKLSLFEPQT